MADDDDVLPVIAVRTIEGRTGSTLMMQLLGTSDQIVFDRRYPAEYRFLSYFARMSRQMTEPFDPAVHVGVTPFFFGAEPAWGPVPFETDVVDIEGLANPLFRSMWAAWSQHARSTNAIARFYAEKVAVDVGVFERAGIPVKVIDLVRDPRDVVASIRAFTPADQEWFHRKHGQSERDFLVGFVARFRDGLERVRGPLDANRIVVRYEDLVSDFHETSTRIAAWLGIELHADAVLAQQSNYRHHRTTGSVAESIYRWRQDLTSDDAAFVGEELRDLMTEFGYAP